MDYGQYTEAALSPVFGLVQDDPLMQQQEHPQEGEPQDQDQDRLQQAYLQEREQTQGQGQQVCQERVHQDQVRGQQEQVHQRQQVQQLPQLGQKQLRQLQQQQQQLEFFAQLTGSPQIQQVHQAASTPIPTSSTPALGFIAPPPPTPSPWDSPSSVLGGFSEAQLAAAMSMVASSGVAATYGHSLDHSHGYGYGHNYSQQNGAKAAAALLPPITTLEMVEAAAGSTPGSVSSGLPPTPASCTSVMTASPVALRSEFGGGALSDGFQQQHASMQEEQEEQEKEEGQVRYEPPRVIELVERPQRKARTAARRQQQQNNSKTKSTTQAKVGVAHSQRQSQSAKKQQQQRRSEAQVRESNKKQRQVAGASSSSSAQQKQQDVSAKQSVSSNPNAPILATTVPSPGQWYGIHALATASQQRVGVGITPSSTSPSPLGLRNSSNNANATINGIGKQPIGSATREAAREAAHPYPARMRQRRTVSGPAAFAVPNNGTAEDADGEDEAPSPARSLPERSPTSASADCTTSTAQTRFPSAPPLSTNRHVPTTGPRYLVRTDLHYDISSNTLTAMLEIPGVSREAIRIALGNDARSGVRMIIVRGRMRRVVFPPNPQPGEKREKGNVNADEENEEVEEADRMRDEEDGYVVKERKCGEFKRVLVVPQETKIEDIKVSMADGILFLRYPAGEQNVDGVGLGGIGAGTFPNKSKPDAPVSTSHTSTSNSELNPTPTSDSNAKPNSKASGASAISSGTRSQTSSRSPSKASTPAPSSTAVPLNPASGAGPMQYNFRLQRVKAAANGQSTATGASSGSA